MRDAIQFTAFILQSCITCQWWQDLSSGQIVANKNFLELAMQLLHVNNYMQVSSIVTQFLREVTQAPHIFSIARTNSKFGTLAIFAYSTSTAQDDLDQLSLFDADFSFWVCDNSATGHICKDKALFTGDLVPTIYEISSATGMTVPNLMGMVTLRLTDDEGEKHLFILNNVNYLPDSLVNLLSLR
jgi:hypothetical protein